MTHGRIGFLSDFFKFILILEIVLILCPFSEMDRKCAYAKACISGNVEALLKLRALCKYLLGRILLVGLPEIAVTAECNAGYGIYKWIVHSI